MTKPTDLLETCEGCRYWRGHPMEMNGVVKAECRRYPPAGRVAPGRAGYPSTWQGCGEHSELRARV